MGEKLNLRQASYEGLQNVKRVEKNNISEI